MAYTAIGLGASANDGTGDDLRAAGTTINANTTELYNRVRVETSAPGVNDDINATTPVEVGCIWVDQTGGNIYICEDNTDGAANWIQVNN